MIDPLESRRLFSGGDFNGDGTVSTLDYNLFANAYQHGLSTPDVNGDHKCDTIEFNQLAADFGKTFPVDQPPAPGTWHQVFNDDFDQAQGPLARGYTLKMWGGSGIGDEIDDPAMVTQANGVLTLTAKRMSDGIHSGQIHSGGNLLFGGSTPPLESFKFGYIEARVDLPDAIGTWPTFWMMPTPNPALHDGDGEIDIFDNGSGNPNQANGFVHLHGSQFGHDNFANLSGGMHVLGIDWEPTFIQWYVDGQPIANMRTTLVPQTASYFILALQVNGWGTQISPSFQTAHMDIDRVTIWQH